ncbi:MAG: hypothetical protein ACTHOK_03090 [Nocardioidaceae bacterium]
MGTVTAELQSDDGRVRVSRWVLARGEDTGPHRHEHDYVVVPIADATMTVVSADGTRSTNRLQAGVSYLRSAGVEHTVSNEHDQVVDFVEIEMLGTAP